ncbi:HlyD family type I secretion periplasmic adaptor subunit [Nitratireductor sp. ZSWI3]|uniref:HlyD family type I secretion periplasmic adaptor subunit n=1 Tax=Nitratireductor sp. ZSWI3 TaxID=2966359 RepID=UPI00214FDD17|nr:HlyD family type I secretion periplasmic adaptor subunit [Nitratireductor sp. ZSWI3]MCR4265864.1 HlyD family type I secretion periplasmic adaptor subunit [Nitratireductor sp. ZSWI3]
MKLAFLSAGRTSNIRYDNPLMPALWGAGAIVLFILLFVIWGYAAPLSSAAIAEGSLQVQARRQSVEHPYGGVISRLLVMEGQRVVQGQSLIELDGTDARAKLDIANAEVVALLAEQARLVCERDDQGPECLDAFANANSQRRGMEEAIANERAVMLARGLQYEAEKGMLTSNVAQLWEKISGLTAQIQGLSAQEASLEEELKGARKLLESGFTPRTRVHELERLAAQILADKGSRIADMAGAKQAISEAELAVAKLDRERITALANQIRQTQSALAGAIPKLEAAQDVVNRTTIKSPVSGSIVDLSVFTEGGVIQPGARLMDIVPDDNPIIVEARLPLSDINYVEPGQEVDVQLVGIPRNERPQIRGEIISVSADKITDPNSGASYFALRARLNPDDLSDLRVRLQPGMPAEVIVTTKSRTLAAYLLGPLLDEVGHAFREQ